MKKYDMIIFDLDGTLLDTTEGILGSVKYTVEKYGLVEPEEAVMKTFIGPPITDSFIKYYGIDNETANELTTVFRNRYKDVDLLKAKPYEGIFVVFENLKNIRIKSAIATYKRHDYAEKLLRHYGFSAFTDIIFGGDNDNKLKKKDIIEKCIRVGEIGDCSRVLMIGDSDNDAIGAKLLGIDFLGVTYGFGFRTKEEIYDHGAVYAADTVDEIWNFIKKGIEYES